MTLRTKLRKRIAPSILKFGGVFALLLFLSSCANSTKFAVPNYYQTKLVSEYYQPGESHTVDSLRCSERHDKCIDTKPENWRKHRTYNKTSYFE